MIQYSLEQIIFFQKQENNYSIPENTLEIINSLSKEVGAPEYIKTPQFKNKAPIVTNRRRKKNLEINDEDWQTIRNFQTTEILKTEGIEKHLDFIRKNLNKITLSNYDNIKLAILKELNEVSENKDDLKYLAESIFKITSNNILYSKIYTKLYNDLSIIYNVFLNTVENNFTNFECILDTIEYCSPEEDYDKFCENNSNNEKRRALCMFYVNLMNEKLISNEKIGKFILDLFKKLFSYINFENKRNEVDELSELLYILIVNGYSHLLDDHCKDIHKNVSNIIDINFNDYMGITNKCIFKHMDILKEIE